MARHQEQVPQRHAHADAAGEDDAVLEVVQRGIRGHRVVDPGQQRDPLEDQSEGAEQKRTVRREKTGHRRQATIGPVIPDRERPVPSVQHPDDLQANLRDALRDLPPSTTRAIARALERDGDRLIAGRYEDDAGDGCLLTLAARELGVADTESLLTESIASVRVPALFDEVWAEIIRRTGDPTLARRIVHRLVVEALIDQPGEEAGSDRSPVAARSALRK
jgi:hypothetical protein